ncbi:MAG: choice-of-anchor D domain-containing protein, partial [Candidatus Cloacimonadaceae bacterium]|nr:choice-of-anchor D domain-containing protein [Candidatus Cloacimonadaceae bacterium]
GFGFMLDEVVYTQFRANSNGFITLNPTSTASLTNNLTSQILILGGLWDDLKTDDTDSHVAYQLSGTSPNQILTVEFKNVKWYYNATPVNLVNFQIKLYHGSNKIEYVYGNIGATPGTSATASIGVSGATAGNYISITPASPTATYSSAAEFNTINSTHVPFLTGNKYEFLPPVPANNDLAATAINGNTTPSMGSAATYTVTVYNRGANAQNSYTVQLINASNTVLASAAGPAVASGETIQVPVQWTPATEGPVALRGKVVLAGDENASNDITPVLNVTVMPQGIMVVTVGDGSQTARMPIDMYFRNSLNQTLYYPTELGLVGNISAITLYNQFLTATLMDKPTKIWLGMTQLNDLSAGWIPATEMTLVFDGTVSYPAGENNIVIPLQTIFPYTGGNLVVMFNRPMDTAFFSSSDLFKAQTIGTNRARNIVSDSVTYDPNAPTGGTLTGQFAKTSFHMTPLGNDPMFLVNPSSKNYGTILIDTVANQTFTIMNGGGGSLTINSITIAGSPHYSLQNLPALPVSLGTGQSATFVGRFNPTAEGTHTATISITDNQTRTTHTVALTGNCIDTTINALPYTQNFDTVTVPALPIDWSALLQTTATGAYVRTATTTPQSPPNTAVLFNSTDINGHVLLVAPPLNTSIPVNTARLKLWARPGGANYSISVGVLTDPLDPTTYQEIQNLTLPTTTWTEFSIPFTTYTGTGRYIAIKHPHGGSSRTLYVDTVTIELIAPNDLAAVSIQGNATPSVGTVSNYIVNVFNNGTAPQNTYQVKLFTQGDIEVGSVDGPAINPGTTQAVTVPWNPTTVGATFIYGKVLLTGDQNPTNDQTPNFNVAVQPPGLTVITVGTGDQQARMPVDMFWKNSLYQGIYYPADLGNTIGMINAIAFHNNFTTNLPQKPTKVWIGTTTQADLTASWIPSNQMTLVFDGVIDYPSGQNTIMIP